MRIGNTFRINFRAFDVVIRDPANESRTCAFIAGALVRAGDPAPVAEYHGGDYRIAAREVEAGPWRIEMINDPSILERYQGKS